MKEQVENGLVAISKVGNPTIDVLNLNLNSDINTTMEILTKLVSSKKLGSSVNTPEQALGYYVKTKELGLPFITGIDHIFDVNGKTSLDVHAMRALVLRAGVIHWELNHGFAPQYKYIDNTKQTVATGVNDSCLPDTHELVKGNTEEEQGIDYKRILSIGKTPVFKLIDKVGITTTTSFINYSTKYTFTRLIKFGNQTKIIIEYGEFSILEAVVAGLHLKKDGSVNINSPWLVYPRTMLEHRAWTFGARKIADDILFGLLETTELMDVEKMEYTIEEGKAKVIN